MADYSGCKCPVCQQPFAEGDDVVATLEGVRVAANSVTEVTVDPATLSLTVGQEAYPTVTVEGTGAFDKGYVAYSNDATKVEVKPDGRIVAIAATTAPVTVTYKSIGDPTKTATCAVTVTNPVGA